MEDKELTKWNFIEEIKNMAESCIGIKKDTARKKAANILKKYNDIVSHSKLDNEYYRNKYRLYEKMFNTLKEGKVYYSRPSGIAGVLLIKDIEQIEVNEKDVLIITRSGRSIIMGSDFNYLKNLI